MDRERKIQSGGGLPFHGPMSESQVSRNFDQEKKKNLVKSMPCDFLTTPQWKMQKNHDNGMKKSCFRKNNEESWFLLELNQGYVSIPFSVFFLLPLQVLAYRVQAPPHFDKKHSLSISHWGSWRVRWRTTQTAISQWMNILIPFMKRDVLLLKLDSGSMQQMKLTP